MKSDFHWYFWLVGVLANCPSQQNRFGKTNR